MRKIEKLLTPERLCEMLAIERSTLYAWTSKRRIPFVKVNGLLRFRESEICRWLKLREQGDIIFSRVEDVLRKQA